MTDINALAVENYTLRDLRVAAKTAEVCGQFQLARDLLALHNSRMLIDPQPAPVNTEESKEVTVPVSAEVFPRAARLLRERKAFGLRKYGTPLKTHNGRDPRIDELQELLDACYYRTQGQDEGRSYRDVKEIPSFFGYLQLIESLAKAIEEEQAYILEMT